MADTAPSLVLDLAPPKKWRRFIPAWLRSLIWVDSARNYDAFLSYNWRSDSKVAAVIQSLLQQFLCPWYKVRAKTVFRDLSALPAGSSLQKELYERLDRSTHLIVLACPDATRSGGMELEARYWFSQPRRGEVLLIATEGEFKTWNEIRDRLVPESIRANLASEPLWISLKNRRSGILANPNDERVRGQLVEDLKQVFLRLYAPQTWEELQGAERAQRRRALRVVFAFAVVFLVLAFAAGGFAWYAVRQQRTAESRQLAAQSQQVADYDPALALKLGIQAGHRKSTAEAQTALNRVLEGPLVHLILHHQGAVRRVVYSPDGKRIATGSEDGTARIWDAEQGTLLATLNGRAGKISAVAFSADGTRLVTGAENGMAHVWNVSNGDLLRTLKEDDADAGDVDEVSFSGDSRRVVSAFTNGNADLWDASNGSKIASLHVCTDFNIHAAFSPDSRLLVTTGSGCVVAELWDASNGQHSKTIGHFDPKEAELFQGHGRSRGMADAVFSPDSDRLLTVMWQDKTQLWDVETGNLLGSLGRLATQIAAAGFSPDGKQIVTATTDFRVIVWDAGKLTPGEPLVGHTGSIFMVSFTPDGKRIVTASTDNTVRVWDAQTWDVSRSLIATLGGGPVQSLLIDASFSPDGKRIATARRDNTARVWDTEKSHPLTVLVAHGGRITDAAFSADGKRVVAASKDAWVWDATTWRPLLTLEGPSNGIARVMFAAGGTRIVTLCSQYFQVWEASTGRLISTAPLIGPLNARESRLDMAFSPDRKEMAALVGNYKTIKIWDLESGQELASIVGHADNIKSVAFSPDGKRIVTSSLDKTVRIWNAHTGQQITKFPYETSIFEAVFLPDGESIIAAEGYVTARRQDAKTGKVLATFNGFSSSSPISGILLSRDGRRILTRSGGSSNDLELWDSSDGRLVATLSGHTGYITTSEFSPDEEHLLTGSRDRTARIWDARTGQLKAILSGHSESVEDATFSPDGSRLITIGSDNTVRLWDAKNADLLATFQTRPSQPYQAIFSPDGKHVLVAGSEPELPMYVADFDEQLAWAEKRLPKESGK